MNEREARRLKVGEYINMLGWNGKVVDLGSGGVLIHWEDGDKGWVDFRDFERIQSGEVAK